MGNTADICFRKIWVATKKDFPSFPTEVHSSHLRKMATALAHLYGDDKLRGTVHDALNHSMSTNHKSYKSTIRRHEVAEAKLSIRSLWKDKSGEMKQRLVSGRNSSSVEKNLEPSRPPTRPPQSQASDSHGSGRQGAGKRVTKSPRFLSDYVP